MKKYCWYIFSNTLTYMYQLFNLIILNTVISHFVTSQTTLYFHVNEVQNS